MRMCGWREMGGGGGGRISARPPYLCEVGLERLKRLLRERQVRGDPLKVGLVRTEDLVERSVGLGKRAMQLVQHLQRVDILIRRGLKAKGKKSSNQHEIARRYACSRGKHALRVDKARRGSPEQVGNVPETEHTIDLGPVRRGVWVWLLGCCPGALPVLIRVFSQLLNSSSPSSSPMFSADRTWSRFWR